MEQTKITFLGTAAANFLPELKTIYKDCFDKTARRASCMLIGENYLIDCGMEQGIDVFQNVALPISPSQVDAVFLTHAHIDHSGMLQ